MSKRAEQKALEAYPDTYTKYRKEGDPEGVESGICTIPDTHYLERISFIKGYEQAEEDLALTWEDMKEIQHLLDVVWSEQNITALIDEDTIYKETLKRFNELKK